MLPALRQSALPRFLDWDASLEKGYVGHPARHDYAEYVTRLKAVTVDDTAHLRLEAALNAAVECDFDRALELAASCEVSGTAEIARKRFVGCLYRQVGATSLAKAAYTAARELARASSGEGNAADAAIAVDIVELSNHERDVWQANQELMLHAPTNTAYAFARSASANALAKEAFVEHFRTESSMRFRSGMPEELRWHNVSLAVAYLVGDFADVREARLALGRELAIHADRTRDNDLGLLALNELLAALAADDVESFLDRRGHELYATINLDRRISQSVPRERNGVAAEALWRVRLSLLRSLGQFLSETTRRELTSEMLATLDAAFGGTTAPLLSSAAPYRSRHAFVEVFGNVAALTGAEMIQLADLLRRHPDELSTISSLWQIVARQTVFQPDDAAALPVVTALTSSSLPDDGDDAVADTAVALSKWSSKVDALLDPWLLANPRWLSGFDRVRVFLTHRHTGVGVENYVASHIKRLAENEPAFMRDDDARQTAHAPHLLTAAFKLYADLFPTPRKAEILQTLLEATRGAEAHISHKTSIFIACAESMAADARLADVLRGAIVERVPHRERGRSSALVGRDEDEGAVMALSLLWMRIHAGIKSTESDQFLVVQGHGARSTLVRRAAIDVAGTMFRKEGALNGRVLVERALLDDAPRVRARAVWQGVAEAAFADEVTLLRAAYQARPL